MTAVEAYERFGPYCLIGGLAVNCCAEPVYTLDVEVASRHSFTSAVLSSGSRLRIQFSPDDRYQSFLERAVAAEVLGVLVKVASLEDVTQGKLWAYRHPSGRFSKRKKDELDLVRLADVFPELNGLVPNSETRG